MQLLGYERVPHFVYERIIATRDGIDRYAPVLIIHHPLV